ncbi:MAG: Fic family protein [Verrucomicrobia bacterium]|nr:Fic family protein [Verrucomicrobiota bacterium]
MAGGTTPPEGATRFVETTRGLLSYSQLAPLLAERVLEVERSIAERRFHTEPFGPDLILRFHSQIANDLVPEWAGRWRNVDVRVGVHHPPLPHRVPALMRDYGEDIRIRLEHVSGHLNQLLLETLAFTEGRLLSIHPFNDFNGRVTRLFLRELLLRLELPPVDLVPTDGTGEETYFAALHSGDRNDWIPLIRVWETRFEQFTDSST